MLYTYIYLPQNDFYPLMQWVHCPPSTVPLTKKNRPPMARLSYIPGPLEINFKMQNFTYIFNKYEGWAEEELTINGNGGVINRWSGFRGRNWGMIATYAGEEQYHVDEQERVPVCLHA